MCNIRTKLPLLLFILLIFYLLSNSGAVSDDFCAIARFKGMSFADLLKPEGVVYSKATPLEYYVQLVWYKFFSADGSLVINLFKILYITVSFYFISRFFGVYVDRKNALLLSFLFLFLPTHEASTYWFMGQYLTLSMAFYLYAFYLAYNNKLVPAFISALAASFISYGSPPIAIALFVLFVLNKNIKKGLVLLIPNIVYCCYYLYLTRFIDGGADKLCGKISVYFVVKNFVLQIAAFIDATIGPSIWLKFYHSFSQLTALSIIIGIALTIAYYIFYKEAKKAAYDSKLIISLTLLTFLSFLMFAMTGRYPQIVFNLGNRVTIFGSLFITYLIVLLPLGHKMKTVAFAIMIFAILGISDHWKEWNLIQNKVISNIKNNTDLQNYSDSKPIYVTGHQYSKFGKMSHIEFFSEDSTLGIIFSLALKKDLAALPLNKSLSFEDGFLIDRKSGLKIKVDKYINVYDSEKDALFKVSSGDIDGFIDSLPPDNRHWLQLVNISCARNAILKIMPKLVHVL